jgi:hypothetical protein
MNYEIGYRGQEMRPGERPPQTDPADGWARDHEEFRLRGWPTSGHGGSQPWRMLPERLAHLRDDPAAWNHGVPPLRPAVNRDRRPSRGGRRYDEIFLTESEHYAGDAAVHFASGCRETAVPLTMTDLLALQAAVTDPARPVTGRQAAEFLRALLASDGPTRDGWDPADAAAMHRVLKLLGEE